MCQIVLFLHDLIGSACGPTGICISSATSSLTPAVVKGANHRPFDKEQTLFLVQLCVATFRLGLVRREQCSSVCTKITPVPAERDGQETKLVSALHTRGKVLCLFVLLEVCMSTVVLRRVVILLHLLCGFQDQVTVSFVVDA